MITALPPLTPAAPFPLVTAEHRVPSFVAPGIQRTDIALATTAGPLRIHVIAVDPQEPTVHLGVVLADDRLISRGETVSSMARRTGAVAGVNADYYDIGQTNQPLNVVVQGGTLVRTPSRRVAFRIARNGRASIGYTSFSGTASYGTTTVALTGVNELPPQGGVSLVTPRYGGAPFPAALYAVLQPLDGAAAGPGSYRVTTIEPQPKLDARAVALAFGPAALRVAAPPAIGDTVALAYTLDPGLDDVAESAGGGPLLVANGSIANDPYSPAPEETNVRFPVTGAAIEADGTMLFVSVDGRRGERSIGLTRPEFAALLRALGARDAMAFDSGGSATLVARTLGDDAARVINEPSDGRERAVADGIFAYSSAPHGVAPHLVTLPAQPQVVGTGSVTLRGAIVDAAGNRMRAVTLAPLTTDPRPGTHHAVVHDADGDRATIAYETIDRPERLTIVQEPNGLVAQAFDAFGDPLLVASVDAWSLDGRALATRASTIAATFHDRLVASARIGAMSATLTVRVGSHALPVALGAAWRFASAPSGGAGEVITADGAIALRYDLRGAMRAAYANGSVPLPAEPTAFRITIDGDGSGVAVRAAFTNALGERTAITLARRVDWTGSRVIETALPPELAPAPLTLVALYVVPALGGAAVHTTGTLRFSNVDVTVPGAS